MALTALLPVVPAGSGAVKHLQAQLRSRLAQSLWLGGTSCPGGPRFPPALQCSQSRSQLETCREISALSLDGQ